MAGLIDRDSVKRSPSGNLYIERRPKGGNEASWCLDLVERYDAWRDLVNMKPAIRIDVEKAIAPAGAGRIIGACRVDALVWHSDRECSIIEAKTDCAPVAIASGLGQLIYYKAAVEAYLNVKVDALLLAAPQLPPLILEAIASANMPVRFLKRDKDDNLSGLVPSYAGL